jgi:hypothetical protein
MTRTLITLAALLALSAPALAQTVERTIDLTQFGWGRVQAIPVDTDGNPNTEEWAVQGTDFWDTQNANTGKWRVVAVRQGGLCVGDWFDPRPVPQAAASIVRINGRDKLMATDASAFSVGSGRLTIVSLDTPQCK